MVSVTPGTIANANYTDNTWTTTTSYDFDPVGLFTFWLAGVADQVHDRLLVWGGGHADYQGNEMYSLELRGAAPYWRLVTQPAVPMPSLGDAIDWEGLDPSFMRHYDAITYTDPQSCGGLFPGGCVEYCQNYPARCTFAAGGSPASRHTYGGLQYIPSQDALYSIGGSLMHLGFFSHEMWFYSFAMGTWTLTQPYEPLGEDLGLVTSAYNPSNGHILIASGGGSTLYDYTPGSNAAPTVLDPSNHNIIATCNDNAVVDPTNDLFVDAQACNTGYPGSSPMTITVIKLDGSDGYATHANWATGCMGAGWTGMTWDSALGVIVMYSGGGNQLMFLNAGPNPVTTFYGTVPSQQCLGVTIGTTKGTNYPNDPDISGSTQGTNGLWGRFSYFPDADVFVLANSTVGNAWMLRLHP
jgi:hypothetical protein